jgi:integrase
VALGDLDRNLADGMQRPAENVIRDRVLSELEVRSFWTGLAAAAMQEGTRRALRLCLLTGQRVGEVSGMMRNELDIDRALWTIPATRAKNGIGHAVPLSGAALEIILAQLEAVAANCQRAGLPPFPHVFPAPGGRAPIHNTAVSKAVLRRFAGLPEGKAGLADSPFTPHDLRRTAATLMEESGIAPHVIGHVLNHVSVTRGTITSRVYARYDYSREKREALETLAARISAIVAGGSRKVLPFRPEMAAGA